MDLVSPFLGEKSGVHGVMFYGAEEDAVSDAALTLAKGWLCSQPSEGHACGSCSTCGAFERGNLVDLKEIFPTGASSIIKVNAISPRANESGEEPVQSLQEFLRTLPIKSPRKVVVIHEADRMNPTASNALLKILEEPPSYAKLILTTTALGEVLPTIRSRATNVPVTCSGGRERSQGENEVDKIAEQAIAAKPAKALMLAEKLREAAGLFEGEGGARASQAAALRAFAQALQRRAPNQPEWTQAAIEAHRRVLGNGSAGLQIDALMSEIVGL